MLILRVIIGLVILILLGICLLEMRAVYNMTKLLIQPARALTEKTPTDVGLDSWETIRFTSGPDRLQLHGWYIPPQPMVDGATVVYAHGWSGNRTHFLEQAAALQTHGYGALLFDLRNSGESEGEYSSWGYHEAADVLAAVDYLKGREAVNPARIGVMGFSTGGAAVLRAAMQSSDIKLVIVQSSYTAVTDNLPHVITLLGGRVPAYPPLVVWWGEQRMDARWSEVNSLEAVSRLAPRPIMIIHGDQDEVVDVSQGERLFAQATQPKELLIIPGGTHTIAFKSDPTLVEETLVPFLRTHLVDAD